MIINQSKVPVIVDAGIGTASDATIAMEMGCDGVLINSAIANAKNPIKMARAFKNAVISGRDAYLAKRMKKKYLATPSTPTEGLI
jgi:thiazole synthase